MEIGIFQKLKIVCNFQLILVNFTSIANEICQSFKCRSVCCCMENLVVPLLYFYNKNMHMGCSSSLTVLSIETRINGILFSKNVYHPFVAMLLKKCTGKLGHLFEVS